MGQIVMNCFRMTPDRSLDKEYLTTCAVYRCVKRRNMSKEAAIATLSQRWPNGENKNPRALVDLWFRNLSK